MAILTSAGITFGDSTTQTTAATASIPSGTVMLFVQTAAPTGFTKSTTHDNKALRVVSGAVGSGGSTGFTSALGTPAVSGSISVSGTVGNHTLTTAQLASHTHPFTAFISNQTGGGVGCGIGASSNSNLTTSATGSNSAHNHSFSGSGSLSSATATINVSYVDVIIATKD